MLNAISANFLRSYQTASQLSNQATMATANKDVAQSNPLATANTTVEISEEGLALSKVQGSFRLGARNPIREDHARFA